MFSRDQALRAGFTPRMIESRLASRRWEMLSRGVYRLADHPMSWRQRLLAATIPWQGQAAASHRSAAPLWALDGFDEGPLEIRVRHGRRSAAPGVMVYGGILPRHDVTVVDRISVTTPARTLIDLAAVVPPDVLEEAIDDAIRKNLVTLPRLRRRFEQLAVRGRPGIAVMRELLDVRELIVPASVFERRFLRRLRAAGHPEPELQHNVWSGGRLVAVIDFAYPDIKLAVETDGFRWHSGRQKWEDDLDRRNVLTALGWRIVHVTWRALRDHPARVMAQIAEAMVCPS